MDLHILVHGLIIRDMDKVLNNGRMVKPILGNGMRIKWVVKVRWNGRLDVPIKDVSIEIEWMVMEYLNGQVIFLFFIRMDDCLRVSLKMVALMVKGDILMKELHGLVNGMMGNIKNG